MEQEPCGDSGMMNPWKTSGDSISIRPSKLYSVSNAVIDFANRRVNGMVKRYMERQIWSQRESVDFPAKYRNAFIFTSKYIKTGDLYHFAKGDMDQDKAMIFLHGGGA